MLNCLNPHRRKTHSRLSKFRLTVSLTAVSCVLLGVASPAQAGNITNISPQIFQCMRRNTEGSDSLGNRGFIVYPNSNSGTITVWARTIFGNISAGSVNFSYNPSSMTLSISNPQGAGGPQVESGMRVTAERCRRGELR